MKKPYAILTVLVALSLALTACGPKAQSPAPAPAPKPAPIATNDDWCNGVEFVKALYQHLDGTVENTKHDDILVVTAWWHNPDSKLTFKWGDSKFSSPASAQAFNTNFGLVGDDAEVFLDGKKIEKIEENEYKSAGSGGIYICYNTVP